MSPTTLRTGLAWIAALLIVVLWYFSQSPWSEVRTITSERNWYGTREYTESKFPDEIGAKFYFGGSFLPLFVAAGWLVKSAVTGESDRLPGVVTLGAAALAIIAIYRFKLYFDGFGTPYLNLNGGSGGHSGTFELGVCIGTTVALVAVGAALLVLGPTPKSETSAAE